MPRPAAVLHPGIEPVRTPVRWATRPRGERHRAHRGASCGAWRRREANELWESERLPPGCRSRFAPLPSKNVGDAARPSDARVMMRRGPARGLHSNAFDAFYQEGGGREKSVAPRPPPHCPRLVPSFLHRRLSGRKQAPKWAHPRPRAAEPGVRARPSTPRTEACANNDTPLTLGRQSPVPPPADGSSACGAPLLGRCRPTADPPPPPPRTRRDPQSHGRPAPGCSTGTICTAPAPSSRAAFSSTDSRNPHRADHLDTRTHTILGEMRPDVQLRRLRPPGLHQLAAGRAQNVDPRLPMTAPLSLTPTHDHLPTRTSVC